MKTNCLIAILALASAMPTAAKQSVGGLDVEVVDISESGDMMNVKLRFDANSLKMKSDREVVYTPMLVNGSDTARMEPFVIAGRSRWYNRLRNEEADAPAFYRAGEIAAPIEWRGEVAAREWMKTATLQLDAREQGCCRETQLISDTPLAQIDMVPQTFSPEFAYVVPKAEKVKTRAINARAYIDFPVNKTVIYPDYRRNPAELAKIRATIDSVRNDENLTITSIAIKGFASPEGSYANNTRLADGRTKALADYVRSLYHFGKDVISMSYEPEDWSGLRAYVDSPEGRATLSNSAQLLAVIDSPLYDGDDDKRENIIKTKFTADYKFLLANVYPGLRHSDYTVNYIIRSYSDPAEIVKVMRTAPQNLSLEELYVAAQAQEPGSDIYNEAFEIAVRMYPDDETANLNAACSAMQRNDLKSASKYLLKAGESVEAQYARALLTALEGDNAKAQEMISKLPELPQANRAAGQLKAIAEKSERGFRVL